jgi:hypothetical protein
MLIHEYLLACTYMMSSAMKLVIEKCEFYAKFWSENLKGRDSLEN